MGLLQIVTSPYHAIADMLNPNSYTASSQPNYGSFGPIASAKAPSGPAPKSLAPVSQNTAEYGGGGGGGAATTSSSTPVVNPYQAQIDALNAQLGTLDTYQNNGLSNIGNSYNTQRNSLLQQLNQAHEDYAANKGFTEQGYTSARNAAQSNAHNKLSALQRLLGIHGAGNSSAAQDAVPLAVSQESTQALAPVQTAYTQNRYNQDKANERTDTSYNQNVDKLGQDRYAQENSLKAAIAQQRADLLSKIQSAGGPNYADEVTSLLQQIAQLSNTWQNPVPLQAGPVQYQAPNLIQYLLGQTTSPQQTNVGGDSVDPLFVPLLGKKEDQLAVA